MLSENGIETDPEKIQKVQDWPRPSNVDDVRAFLGFTGYNRRFVGDFSRISRPLNEMLAGIQRKKSKKKIIEPKPWKGGAEEESYIRISGFHKTIYSPCGCLWLWFGGSFVSTPRWPGSSDFVC